MKDASGDSFYGGEIIPTPPGTGPIESNTGLIGEKLIECAAFLCLAIIDLDHLKYFFNSSHIFSIEIELNHDNYFELNRF